MTERVTESTRSKLERFLYENPDCHRLVSGGVKMAFILGCVVGAIVSSAMWMLS